MPYLPPLDYRPPIDTFTTYFLNQRLLRTCARKSRNVFSKNEVQKLIDLYDGAINYLNNQIKSLLERLEKIGVNPDNTYFVITSDHGDEFGEEGGIGHPPFRDIEALLHVPLIIIGPNLSQEKITEKITLDYLNPNIIKLLNLPVPNKLQSKIIF
jgi:arylsulfatase A-like enzyme